MLRSEHADHWRRVGSDLRQLVQIVAGALDTSVEALRGSQQRTRLVHARSIVAVLAEELLDSTRTQTEDVLLRGKGLVNWYLQRHPDRMKAYPEYAQAYAYCRALAMTEFSAVQPIPRANERRRR